MLIVGKTAYPHDIMWSEHIQKKGSPKSFIVVLCLSGFVYLLRIIQSSASPATTHIANKDACGWISFVRGRCHRIVTPYYLLWSLFFGWRRCVCRQLGWIISIFDGEGVPKQLTYTVGWSWNCKMMLLGFNLAIYTPNGLDQRQMRRRNRQLPGGAILCI